MTELQSNRVRALLLLALFCSPLGIFGQPTIFDIPMDTRSLELSRGEAAGDSGYPALSWGTACRPSWGAGRQDTTRMGFFHHCSGGQATSQNR